MSDKLKIRVTIADRTYPLTINRDEEEGVRKAVKNINDLAVNYENNYAVNDKQDVLAMCILQIASNVEVNKISNQLGMQGVESKLKEINSILDSHL